MTTPLSQLRGLNTTPATTHDRVSAALVLSAVRRRRQLRRLLALGSFALTAVTLFLIVARRAARPLEFYVGEAREVGALGTWLEASQASRLHFSDGSEMKLEPGSAARVLNTTERGAHVLLERGRARVHVEPRPKNDWTLVLGPFDVHVTGTTFDASWDPERAELLVTMREGHVVVTASCLKAPAAVAAGETVRMRCDAEPVRGSDAVTDAGPRQTRSPAPFATVAPDTLETVEAPNLPPAPPGPIGVTLPSPPPFEPSSADAGGDAFDAPPSTWQELLAVGRGSEALRAVQSQGVDGVVASASANDLLELGQSARFLGQLGIAKEAYAAIRKRFAGTETSALAAFHLGRLAVDDRDSKDAYRWFSTYLDERPRGGLAAEAWGRRLEIEAATDPAKAKESAKTYLRLFPNGAHAALARSLSSP